MKRKGNNYLKNGSKELGEQEGGGDTKKSADRKILGWRIRHRITKQRGK